MAYWDAAIDAVTKAVEDAAWSVERRKYGGTSLGESASSATGASGHFRFPDADAARQIRDRFHDRLKNMEKREEAIRQAQRSLRERFAEDPESESYRSDALNSLDRLDELNESMKKYTENYINKINRAISGMRAIDDDTADGLDKGARV